MHDYTSRSMSTRRANAKRGSGCQRVMGFQERVILWHGFFDEVSVFALWTSSSGSWVMLTPNTGYAVFKL